MENAFSFLYISTYFTSKNHGLEQCSRFLWSSVLCCMYTTTHFLFEVPFSLLFPCVIRVFPIKETSWKAKPPFLPKGFIISRESQPIKSAEHFFCITTLMTFQNSKSSLIFLVLNLLNPIYCKNRLYVTTFLSLLSSYRVLHLAIS